MRSAALRLLAVVSVLAGMLLLASCSGAEPEQSPASTSETPVITGEPAGSNANDVSFATNMIEHHKQSVDLAALVPDRSTNPDVVAVASSITAARGPEIEVMKALLVQWSEGSATGPGGAGAPPQGAVDPNTVARLETLSGQDFDVLWLQSMITHAQGAIAMANAEIANGDNVDAVALARRMVDAQRAEIDQMQQILAAGG